MWVHRNSTTGLAVVVMSLDPGQGVQALPGEAFGQQRQEVGHGAAGGELVVAGVQEPFDGLGAEDAVELVGQPGGGGAQGQLLVDGQVRACGGIGVSGQSWSASGG